MALDVPVPEPPRIEGPADPDSDGGGDGPGEDYRRAELEAFLNEGAWDEAFLRWAADTDLSESDYAIVSDLDLLEQFDFFWDDVADRVGYHAPGLPEDWRERDVHPAVDSWGTVSAINANMTELGQVVCDVLAADYVDWGSEFQGPDDLPEF